ncbi:MAG: M20/M25/M40 family metallo-hydrolase [Gemmatimonadota bacterium]
MDKTTNDATASQGLGRRKFLKGASVLGGAMVASGLAGREGAAAEGPAGETTTARRPGLRRPGQPATELTEQERRVLTAIRSEEVAAVLQDFVQIRTTMSDEQTGAEYFSRRLREWGIEDAWIQGVEGYPGRSNLIARLPGRTTPKGPTLLATSHLDAIAVDDMADREQWTDDPYSGAIRDGRVYGRGASDNKSGCVSKIMAAKAIREAGVELPGDLLIALVADEEGYMLGIKQFIKSGLHKEVSAALSEGAGTGSRIRETVPGRTSAMITFYGTNAHAGTSPLPGVGVNAIHKASKFIAAIADAAPNHPRDPYYGPSFYQVLQVTGGWPTTQTSQKPAFCRLFLDTRLVPDHDPDDVWRDVQVILDRLSAEDPDFRYSIGEIDRRPGYRVDFEWPVVKAIASAYEALAGRPPELGDAVPERFAIGTTDTHYLAQLGIPCASVVSPVRPDALGHAANEYMGIEALTEATKATALTIMRYWDFAE